MKNLALLLGAMLVAACDNAPTTLLVEVTDPALLAPNELRLSVYGERGVLARDQSVSVDGLPGAVLITVPAESQLLRVGIEARDVGVRVGQGAASVRSQRHRQVRFSMSLSEVLPDSDGDLVPDPIDNCATVANEDQRDTDGDGVGDVCEAGSDLGMGDLSSGDLGSAAVDQAGGSDLSSGPPDLTSFDLLGQTPPSLFAVWPEVTEIGKTVFLEGAAFADPLVVQFPGGVTATATLLSSSRASVVVPTGAGRGDLRVSAATQTSNPVPFRATSFALGLGGFQLDHEQGPHGRQTTRLTEGLHRFGVVNTGRYVYLVGGRSSASRKVTQRALINSDGTLDRFEAGGVSLGTARENAALVRIGDRVYVLGGFNDADGDLASIEQATIQPDGTLGAFSPVSSVLTTPRASLAACVVGSYLYVSGGGSNTIERCPINPDRSLGTCSSVGNLPGPAPFFRHAMWALRNTLYLAGAGTTTVLTAPILANGDLGTVEEAAISLGRKAGDGAIFVLGDAAYSLGGIDDVGTHGAVQRSTISPATQQLQSFVQVTANTINLQLAQKRYGGRAVLVDNYVYLIGGYDSGSLDVHEHATINASGQLDPFVATGTSTTADHDAGRIAIVGDQLYIVAGETAASVATKTIEQATIGSDGSVGAFQTSAASLVVARRNHAMVRAGVYLYVIGGYDGSNTLRSIERALLDGNGLGAFEKLEENNVTGRRALQSPRSSMAAVVAGKYLYILGGNSPSSSPTDVIEQAELDANGDLVTDFSVAASTKLTYLRAGNAAVRIGNELYVTGGFDTLGESVKIVERITTAADGALPASNFADAGVGQVGYGTSAALAIGPYVYAFAPAYVTNTYRFPLRYDGAPAGMRDFGQDLRNNRWFANLFVTGNYVFVVSGWDFMVYRELDRALLK